MSALAFVDQKSTDAVRLKVRGLLLIGLDVIGDYITEINVTSPTCFQEITDQTGFDVPKRFIDALEAALAAERPACAPAACGPRSRCP